MRNYMRSMVILSVLLMSTGQNNAAQLVSRGVLVNAGHALWTTACTHKKKIVGMLALGGVGVGTYAYSKKKANDHKLAQQREDEAERERSRLEIDRRQAAQDLREKTQMQDLLDDEGQKAARRAAIGQVAEFLSRNRTEKDPEWLRHYETQVNDMFSKHGVNLQFDLPDTDSLKDALKEAFKLAVAEYQEYVDQLTACHEKWVNRQISDEIAPLLQRIETEKYHSMGHLAFLKLQLEVLPS